MVAWTCPQRQSSFLRCKPAVGQGRQSARSARAVSRKKTSPVPHKLLGGRTPSCLEGHGLRRQAVRTRPEAFSSQQQGETEYGDGYEEEEEEEEDDEEETTVEAGGKVTPHACAESTCFEGIQWHSCCSIATSNAHPTFQLQH